MPGALSRVACREQYSEMREEFYAGLEDRKYVTLPEAQKKGLQVRNLQTCAHLLLPALLGGLAF